MVARSLAAQPYLGVHLVSRADDAFDHSLHRLILLVEEFSKLGRVTVDAEGELSKVIAADREAVEALSERFGEDDVRRNLAHDIDLQPVLSAPGTATGFAFESPNAADMLRARCRMSRSFDYAAASGLNVRAAINPASRSAMSGDWRRRTKQSFLAVYHPTIGPSFPRNQALFNQSIEMFVLEKTLYEICCQAANRSGWIHIPLAGVVEIIDHGK